MLVLRRALHTRPKKVTVQFLQESGRRFRGEVHQVSEGHMRLKLHPEGIAAYVLPNEPTPIPILAAEEAQQMRREAQALAKASAAELAQAETKAQESKVSSADEERREKVQSLLDSLSFPTAANQQAGEAAESSPASAERPASSPAPNEAAQKKQFAWQTDFVADMTQKK